MALIAWVFYQICADFLWSTCLCKQYFPFQSLRLLFLLPCLSLALARKWHAWTPIWIYMYYIFLSLIIGHIYWPYELLLKSSYLLTVFIWKKHSGQNECISMVLYICCNYREQIHSHDYMRTDRNSISYYNDVQNTHGTTNTNCFYCLYCYYSNFNCQTGFLIELSYSEIE